MRFPAPLHLLSLCAVVALLAPSALAEEPKPVPNPEAQALYQQAVVAYEQKDYNKSIELALASIEKGAKRGTAPYHLACCYALTGKTDDAFKYLHLAFERGWRDVTHVENDADLKSLHADTRWPAALEACRKARDEALKSVKEPALARELLERMALDQRARHALIAEMAKQPEGDKSVPMDRLPPELDLRKIDPENTAFMKRTLEKHGWPGKTLVGEDAANAAWLLVQHADSDREFQTKALDLLKPAVKAGEATGQQLAYLTDRVLVGQGKPQLYGTQFQGRGPTAEPAPIEDEANVDKRRAEIGLGPLAEYAKQIRGG